MRLAIKAILLYSVPLIVKADLIWLVAFGLMYSGIIIHAHIVYINFYQFRIKKTYTILSSN
jgi:hypothetical protein